MTHYADTNGVYRGETASPRASWVEVPTAPPAPRMSWDGSAWVSRPATAEEQAEDQAALVAEAKALLNAWDHYGLVDYRAGKTAERLAEVDAYREALREVVRGVRTSLPVTPAA